MLGIRQRLETSAPGVEPKLRLELPFELRQKSRLRTSLASGEEVLLMMPRGEVLRGGDLLLGDDGRVVEVVAIAEEVLHVECDTPEALARAAYHLGNRHVAVQVGAGFLRLAPDHVLEDMLIRQGARVSHVCAPFEPEAGAYGGHSHGAGAHQHKDAASGPRIHEYGLHRP